MHFIWIAHQQGHEEFTEQVVDTVTYERRDPYRPPTRARRGQTSWIKVMAWTCLYWR